MKLAFVLSIIGGVALAESSNLSLSLPNPPMNYQLPWKRPNLHLLKRLNLEIPNLVLKLESPIATDDYHSNSI